MNVIKSFVLLLTVLALSACNQGINKEQIKKLLAENPDILTEAIKANPTAFLESMQEAVKAAQGDMAKKREEQEKKEFEDSFKSPLKPNIRGDELIRGPQDAPLLLVEYSDFECPYCTRGYKVVKDLLDQYKGKIKVVFKHLPLRQIHPTAGLAAQYYEALRMQNHDKAIKFHDILFENQTELKGGEAYLKKVAKSVGADMKKLEKDATSQAVIARVEEDEKEAAEFGIQGTPGFILNGVPVRGAYPLSHFVSIIDELKKRGMINL